MPYLAYMYYYSTEHSVHALHTHETDHAHRVLPIPSVPALGPSPTPLAVYSHATGGLMP
jgi:hypothetical protein